MRPQILIMPASENKIVNSRAFVSYLKSEPSRREHPLLFTALTFLQCTVLAILSITASRAFAAGWSDRKKSRRARQTTLRVGPCGARDGTVGEEFLIVRVAGGVLCGEVPELSGIAAKHCGNLNAVNGTGSARMRLRNVSGANQPNVNRHLTASPEIFLSEVRRCDCWGAG
jgi:hypothetical protein